MGDPGVSHSFRVRVDGVDLGLFISVEGLSARYDLTQIREGGENAFVHALPGRIEYETLRITRPVDQRSSSLVEFFLDFQEQVRKSRHLARTTASITALTSAGEELATWTLVGVYPVSYSGPRFDAAANDVLVESFELAHNGFWSAEGSGASRPAAGSTSSGRRGSSLGGF